MIKGSTSTQIKKVHTAVIPAAGFGTRFLPASKAIPKEMIPLVDKPVIQYVVEEAVEAGFDRIAIVISEGKEPVIKHFSPAAALEERLEKTGKKELLYEITRLNTMAEITYIYQNELKGLGDAVLRAKDFAGNEPFAVLLGDTVLRSTGEKSVIGQLKEVYEKTSSSVVAAEHVPVEKISKYGIIDGTAVPGNEKTVQIRSMVEKPDADKAPSDLAVASRYLFTADIFQELENTPPGKGGEIQLTDAMCALLKKQKMFARIIDGKRYDLGNASSFLKSTFEIAFADERFRDELKGFLREYLKEPDEKI